MGVCNNRKPLLIFSYVLYLDWNGGGSAKSADVPGREPRPWLLLHAYFATVHGFVQAVEVVYSISHSEGDGISGVSYRDITAGGAGMWCTVTCNGPSVLSSREDKFGRCDAFNLTNKTKYKTQNVII